MHERRSMRGSQRWEVSMTQRSWMLGGVVGLTAGVLVSATMTFLDWRLNPTGLFHGEQGTHWRVVAETALSWFWPVALIAAVLTILVQLAIAWLRAR
jgi:hypothetical protein